MNKKVLVVGFGNTGSEIAVDLWEQNAKPKVLIRSPINFFPRDLASIFATFDFICRLPPVFGDNVLYYLNEYLGKGLKEKGVVCPNPNSGFVSNVVYHHDIGIIDIGALQLIKNGEIPVISYGIKKFTETTIIFEDGKEEEFDAVILATGYEKIGTVKQILPSHVMEKVLTKNGVIDSGKESNQKGLYFIGYNDAAGRFYEISLEARRIAEDLKLKFKLKQL